MLNPSTIIFQDGTATTIAPEPNSTQTTAPGSTGQADGGSAPAADFSFPWPMLLVGVAIMWFMMINPERKNRKKRDAMLGELKKGDKILTAAGIYGTIVQMQDQIVTLQIADGVRIRLNRGSIQQLESDEAPLPEQAKA